MIENLPEREYLFEVVSFDKFGNKSLPFEVSGKSYGDNYKNYLLNRGINSMVKLDGKIHIIWSEPSEGALYTTIYYTTSAGVDVTINAPVDESETVIEDYLPASVFYYSTIYKPAINSPDIFETEKSTSTFNIFEYKDLDRTGWTSTQSHPRPSDSPSAIAHLDGDLSTFLSLTKPGKSAGGVSIPEGERLFCIIDMNEPRHFCYFRIRHRSETLGLRLWALSIYGSNDGENFSEIKSNIAIPDVQNGAVLESPNIEIPESYYRYVKIFYEEWDLVNNGAIQFTEFYLGMKE
jgi:hypothetical protein